MKQLRYLVSSCSGRASLVFALVLAGATLTAQQIPEHAGDGGAMLRIQSIQIPSIPNAPFSATVVTELTTIMPDGSKRTIWNHRLVARDSAGRVFEERRFFSPTGKTEETRLSEQDYTDPNQHQQYVCRPNRVCMLYRYDDSAVAAAAAKPALPPQTRLADGTTIAREDLGRNTIEGVEALGSREITTLPASRIGSEKPQPMVKEFWYAPQLGINLVTKRFDPRVDTIQNFTVTQINL